MHEGAGGFPGPESFLLLGTGGCTAVCLLPCVPIPGRYLSPDSQSYHLPPPWGPWSGLAYYPHSDIPRAQDRAQQTHAPALAVHLVACLLPTTPHPIKSAQATAPSSSLLHPRKAGQAVACYHRLSVSLRIFPRPLFKKMCYFPCLSRCLLPFSSQPSSLSPETSPGVPNSWRLQRLWRASPTSLCTHNPENRFRKRLVTVQ